MTSISSAGIAPHAFTSPRELLQNELLSEVSSGAISADDQDALSAALDDIDSTLAEVKEAGLRVIDEEPRTAAARVRRPPR